MFSQFEARTADLAWRQLASALVEGDTFNIEESRCGSTREIVPTAISIEDPRQRWVSSRRPAINPAFALVEVFWILSGRRDSAFVNFYNTSLPKFSGSGENYHGAYGYRIRHHLGTDQLTRAYDVLRQDSTSRQVVLQIWDGRIDLPTANSSPRAADIPCNVASILKLVNGKLEWLQIVRSNDVFLGVPYNFVQFTTLQEVVAGWLGVDLGSYNQVSNSLHIYTRNLADLSRLGDPLSKNNTDRITLQKKESDQEVSSIVRDIEQAVRPELKEEELLRLGEKKRRSTAFQNMVVLVLAEAARRRRWRAATTGLMEHCSNPVLQGLWDRWYARVGLPRRSQV